MYRRGIGVLLFLVKFSRPDISNSVRKLSIANDGATFTTLSWSSPNDKIRIGYETGSFDI